MIGTMVDGLMALGTEMEAYKTECQSAVDFLAALDRRRDAIIAQAKALGVPMGKSRKELPAVKWECEIAPSPTPAQLAAEEREERAAGQKALDIPADLDRRKTA